MKLSPKQKKPTSRLMRVPRRKPSSRDFAAGGVGVAESEMRGMRGGGGSSFTSVAPSVLRLCARRRKWKFKSLLEKLSVDTVKSEPGSQPQRGVSHVAVAGFHPAVASLVILSPRVGTQWAISAPPAAGQENPRVPGGSSGSTSTRREQHGQPQTRGRATHSRCEQLREVYPRAVLPPLCVSEWLSPGRDPE